MQRQFDDAAHASALAQAATQRQLAGIERMLARLQPPHDGAPGGGGSGTAGGTAEGNGVGSAGGAAEVPHADGGVVAPMLLRP